METENGNSKSKIEDYEVIQQIGRGAFGAAFLVLHKAENKKYVLKKIRLTKQTEKLKSKEFQEMSIITKLHHPYVVEYKDAWVDKGSCICTVTNYFEVGNIAEISRKARRAYFSEEKLCKWLTQLLLAIDYLHSNRLLHGNLKLSNIFVTKENDIRLGDFGLAKILIEESLASSVGTPNYMCPELLADMPYCYKSDIWSLGCCMFEIAAHQQAFRAPDMAGLINKINKCLISPLPIVYSSTLKQIIKSMLRKSPEHRPTAAELLRHPHLQPFLLRCHNPSTVFLPVKSPSPNNSKEKTKKPSPSTTGGERNYSEREVELKNRELLPLFEESTDTDMRYPNLLESDDALIEDDQLETKRVDPTSYYSRRTSHDSEDLKSGDSSMKIAIPDTVCDDHFVALFEENMTLIKDKVRSKVDAESRNSSNVEESAFECSGVSRTEDAVSCPDKDTVKIKENQALSHNQLLNTQAGVGGDERKGEKEIPGHLKADALESLLELCATLLKQDKFDELSGVLKPFSEDAVSSRETAIWLTKSLMNAQKLAKKS